MYCGQRLPCDSEQQGFIKMESPVQSTLQGFQPPFNGGTHTTAAWMANQSQSAITLPSIHELDLGPDSTKPGDTRRSSTASPSPSTVLPFGGRHPLRNKAVTTTKTRAYSDGRRRHQKNLARALSATPESWSGCESGIDKNDGVSSQGLQTQVQRKRKAVREKTSRFDQTKGLGRLQNGLLEINPDIPKIARRGPGKIGLTLLKSNNLHRTVKQSEHRHDLLEYNKLDVTALATVVLEDDAALFKLFLAYLKTIGSPGSLAPAEAYDLFECAVKNRGCVTFDLTQLRDNISRLCPNAFGAKL